jgi:periplasmic protein CpxP/Spy
MKAVKIMILGLALAGSHGLMAQETVDARKVEKEGEFEQLTPEERAKKRTEKMTEALGLDASQQTQIYAINLAHMTEMEKLRAEQKALHEKIKAEREATRNEIKVVLNDEQDAKFDQMVEEHKARKEQHRP